MDQTETIYTVRLNILCLESNIYLLWAHHLYMALSNDGRCQIHSLTHPRPEQTAELSDLKFWLHIISLMV